MAYLPHTYQHIYFHRYNHHTFQHKHLPIHSSMVFQADMPCKHHLNMQEYLHYKLFHLLNNHRHNHSHIEAFRKYLLFLIDRCFYNNMCLLHSTLLYLQIDSVVSVDLELTDQDDPHLSHKCHMCFLFPLQHLQLSSMKHYYQHLN